MNTKRLVVTTFALAGLTMTAQASTLKAADKSIATDLCMTAVSGNRAAMHNEIKASGKSAKYIAENIQCNGENILVFVERHGKNPQQMLSLLDRSNREVSITDIAQNRLAK